MANKKIIGRKEVVDLPDLNIYGVSAKTDTGAYTSSIHCSHINMLSNNKVECVFLDANYPQYTGKKVVLNVVKTTYIKSSNGQDEKRIVIKTTLKLFHTNHDILFTLSDRSKMKNAILLGRQFLSNKFLVDVTIKNQEK